MDPIIRRFRTIALAEGISYLLLLFVTMPLKYGMDMQMPNKVVGMVHGILFVAYIIMAIPLFNKLKWDMDRLPAVVLASIIPFGTFWLERKYLRS